MEELRDLQQIYKETAEKFNQYNGKDFVLPQLFKDTVREINSNKIIYNEYSAILTSGAQMNIYLPNQWFFIASYFTDFYNELQKYKSIALEVATKERLKDLNGGELSETEMSNVNNLDFSETSKSYLVKFITQYAWWGCAKTIDRGDFYVSPILNCAKLVNASQSFVADLCAFLSDKEELVNTIISGQEKTFIKHKELLRHNKAATFLRKALLITEDKDFDLMRLAALNLYERTAKRLKINGFTFGCDADKLPPRKADVDENVSWTYDSQKYVLYLEWNPDEMETLFFPAYNRAYTDLFLMKKEQDGDYVLYEINKETQNVINESDLPLQQIYYGTPGSGKSHKVKDMVEAAYPDKDEREKYVFRTTFHPDSDYASFVGCYKPQMKDGAITYEFVPQAFTKAYVQAWNEPEKQIYLIVEEINRGNCAQIFGDLFQLLDRKNGVSEYPIDADEDLRQYLEKELNEAGKAGIANGKIKLPANLNILATMNTSDQSLFPMDSAFKRRWNWECVPIDYNNPKSSEFRISIGDQNYKWLDFLKNVNTHIFNTTGSEDKQMGNFFIDSNVDERQFVNKVMFYLWNDVCKDEVGTKNNFFRNYTNAEKDESVEFSFNDLFSADASHILAMFMEYLDVKADEAAQVGEEPETDGE